MEELTLTDKLFYLFNLDLKTHAFISTIIAIPMIAAGYLYRRRALRRETAH
jgi:H+/gluconate symporter-like permease